MTAPSLRHGRLAISTMLFAALLLGPGSLALPATEAPADAGEVAAGQGSSHSLECSLDPLAHKAAPLLETPASEVEATLQDLYAAFEGLPGFVDVYFYPLDGVFFHPTFIGEVPADAGNVETDVPITFRTLPAAPEPAGPGTLPSTDDLICTGIRPGSRISTTVGICTLAFILAAGNDLYAATAGHCVGTGGVVSVDRVGRIGTAIYSTGDGGIGNDFALIKIDDGKKSLVDPEMCSVAGPTGLHTSGTILGEPVVHTGHGLGVSSLTVTSTPPRVKHGVGFAWGANSFTWEGTAVPGDSGSAIRLVSGDALGVVTHIGLAPGNGVGINFGTRLDVQISETGVGGLTLQTVNYTHP